MSNKPFIRAFLVAALLFKFCAFAADSYKLSAPLPALLTTNKQGIYRITPSWGGQLTNSFVTGDYAKPPTGKADPRDDIVQFDLFFLMDEKGKKQLAKSAGGNTYHSLCVPLAELPSDDQISRALDLSNLEKMLGQSRGGFCALIVDGTVMSTASWSVFKLTASNRLEVLNVSCKTTGREAENVRLISDLRIRRATVVPLIPMRR